ncbi:MAG: hypothetical protein ABI867_25210 [Kofleriaceae bacterium]
MSDKSALARARSTAEGGAKSSERLGSASRALLDAARDGMGPDAAAIARMRGKIDAAVGGGVAAGTIASKLGIVAVVGAVAIGGAVYSQRSTPLANETVVVETPAVERATPMLQTAREELPSPIVDEELAMPAIVAPPRALKAPVRPARGIDLGREVALIDSAMAALRQGNATAALAAVTTHATETAGAGQLAEDAAAIEIEALCKLHDARVTPKLAAFDARWPNSAQRSRLATSCP